MGSTERSREAWSENGADEGSVRDLRQQTRHSHTIKLNIHRSTQLIEKKATLLSLVIKNPQVYSIVRKVFCSQSMVAIMTLLWGLCMANFLYYLFQRPIFSASVYIPLQMLSVFVFCIHHLSHIRVGIVKALATSFNFWFAIWNVFSLHLCLGLLWDFNYEIFCLILHSITGLILILVFYDAHSARHVTIMKTTLVVGLISYVPIFVILLFKLADFKTENALYDSDGVQIVDFRLQALDNLSTIIIYTLRIIYTHIVLKKSTTIAFLSNFYEIDANDLNRRRRNMYRHNNATESTEARIVRPNIQQVSEVQAMSLDLRNNPTDLEAAIPGGVQAHPDSRLVSLPVEGAPQNPIDTSKYLLLGIMEDNVIEYDLHHTIFHRYLIKKHPLFATILKSKNQAFFSLFFVIVVPFFAYSLSIGIDFGPVFWYIGLSVTLVGILIGLVIMSVTCNLIMFRHMLFSFDYCYVIFLIVKIIFSSGVLCEWDFRVVFWLYYALNLQWCVMIDTFHISARKLSHMIIVAALWWVVCGILCKWGIGSTLSQDRYVVFRGVQLMSSRITLSSSLFSASLFVVRFVWSYLKNNRRILFMTENVRVEEI